MNSRPPTGVDLALGLNGFSAKEYPIISKPPRVPTTLQPLDERDYLRRSATLRTREEESQKWERIRMEVEKRRFAEEAEARQATDRALQQKQGDCQEVMVETSRQLDRIVAKDWDHQVELNQRRQEEDKLQDQVDAFRIKQAVEDGDRAEEEGRLRKQRQLAEDRENDLNAKLAQRFKEKQLKEHQDLLDKAIYREATKRSQEEEVRRLEEERHLKGVRRQELLGQMVDQEARQRHKDNTSFFEAEERNEEYRRLAEAHQKHLAEAKRCQRDQEKEFAAYKGDMDRAEGLDGFNRDLVFEKKRQALTESAHRFSREKSDQRQGNNVAFYHRIRDQIKEHEAAVLYDRTVIRRKAEETRLEEELEYKNSLLVAKEKKAKDAEEYRKFLLKQMEEKQKLEMSDALKDKVFLHHRMLTQNERDAETRHQVDLVKQAMAI